MPQSGLKVLQLFFVFALKFEEISSFKFKFKVGWVRRMKVGKELTGGESIQRNVRICGICICFVGRLVPLNCFIDTLKRWIIKPSPLKNI